MLNKNSIGSAGAVGGAERNAGTEFRELRTDQVPRSCFGLGWVEESAEEARFLRAPENTLYCAAALMENMQKLRAAFLRVPAI